MNEFSSKGMQILNLGENVLSGELPNCWMNWKKLLILNLDNNNFAGSIPPSMGALTSLRSLHLSKSGLSGKLPSMLENCRELVALDISENEFVGNVPIWIGEKFSKILILILRSNKFHGHFPLELCHLTSLQILDLAYNSISGGIPKCIKNLIAIATVSYSADKEIIYTSSFSIPIEDASLVIKGKAVEYNTILKLVRSIDLSENNFSGEIPTEITNLGALQSLNLSHNFLIGRIPENIGAMISLESIDFSGNQFSGKIPQSISNLTFLNHLNLSDNKLTGRIPLATQLQGFDASGFTGNELCGSPLPWNCTVDDVPVPDYKNGEGKNGDEHEVDWPFYVGMTLGFVVGFWGVIGPLLVSLRWRCVYYHMLDRLRGKLGSIVSKCCW
ncbi:hypothetical protein Ddye_027411 [Dipteronia dyeriana]|uniref:Uncharacterized protein n=1 Tax=Dipteronia dyeriana TaxID=168575 RepID=A0AAD9WQG7_9ROSI|nr:hypothetical protein Ddye_027411 [Dipteronia dyeriana]